MSNIDHIFIYLLLYISLIVTDYIIRKQHNKKIIPILYLIPILIYIFVEGSRYGRGVDYFGYGPNYINSIKTDQPVFDKLNEIILAFDLSTDLPYGICFHAYATIFILSLFKLYNEFRYNTKFFLLLACLATLYMTEWTIRQGVSLSFVLPAIYYLDNKKYIWCIVFLLLSIFTHYGNTLSITLLLFCYFFLNKKPLPIKLTIPLYLILLFSFSSLLPYINDKISSLNLSFLGGNFQGYINNSSLSFGSEAITEEWKRGTFQQILTTSFNCGIIIIGYYFHKLFNEKVYIYNTFIFGILVVEPFHLIGNLTRIFLLASVLWFIPVSLAVYKWNIIKTRKIVQISGFLVFTYLLLYYGRYVFLNPSANYVWNL